MALEAGLDVELPGTDCYGAPLLAGGALRPRRRGDRRHRRAPGCSTTKFELGLFERPFVEPDARRRRSRDTPAHRQPGPPRSPRKSLVLLRNDGILPLRPDVASVAVIGPNADEPRHLLGDYTYPVHVESLQEVLRSGQQRVRHADRRRATPSTPIDRRGPRSSPSCRTASAAGVRFARGCDVNGAVADGLRRGRGARRRVRRRRAGDGRQVRAHRRLHERREPRRVVARPARACRRTSSAPCSTPARRSCSCSSPGGRSAAPRCTSSAPRC